MKAYPYVIKLMLWFSLFMLSEPALAYVASKVFFEARPNGVFRVYVTYTVPALKEVRESFVEFRVRKDAEAFYYDLLNGADFYQQGSARREFKQAAKQPTPW